jgi:mono/diheme cytochrome c family protein
MRQIFPIAAILSVFVPALTAQPAPAAQVVDPQYQTWMKSMQPSLTAIRNAPDNAALIDASNKLADTFDQVARYWKAKQTADAVGFAEKARDAAKAIAAGNGDKTANLQKIQEQCGACHMAHRFQQGAGSDPDRAVKGGKLPEGWSVRPDRGTASQIDLTIDAGVFHFAMGPAGTFYRSDWMKSGDYRFSARLTQMKAPTHPISYGLMFGGSDLGGPNQAYSYFLVRNQGDYYIANRDGDKPPQPVVDWKLHPAIVKQGSDGRQTNTLGIQVQADEAIFTVNGTEVTRLPKSKLHTDGMFAFRIGHNLDVDVDQVKR